jgi:hypothetical protein
MPKATPAATAQQLLDRAAISDVITTYASAMDRREWGLYRDIFLDEVELHFPLWTAGPRDRIAADRWVDIVRKSLTGFDATQHLILNRMVRLDGDRSSVDSHMTARHIYSPSEVEHLGGFYHHGLVRRGKEWKLGSVRLDVTWDEGPRELFARAYARGELRLSV